LGLQSFIGGDNTDVQKLLWICYAFKKTTKMFGLRKGQNVPLLLSIDNAGHGTLTIWQAPDELLPLNGMFIITINNYILLSI